MQEAVPCQSIPLCTGLEVVAVRAIIFNKLTRIGSLYILHEYRFSSSEISNSYKWAVGTISTTS